MSLSVSSAISTTSVAASTTTRTQRGGQVPGDSVVQSGPATFLAKLEALKQSDPAAFKQTLTDLANQLTERAKTETDPKAKARMTEFAGKLSATAQSGDLSALRPPPGQGRPPPPPPPSGATGASTAKSLDPADANQDGTVTQAEQQAYDAQQAVAKGVKAYQQLDEATASSAHAAMFSNVAATH